MRVPVGGSRRGKHLLGLVALLLLAAGQLALSGAALARPAEEVLRERVEQIRSVGTLTIGDRVVTPSQALPDLYEQRGFELLWRDRKKAAELLAAVRAVEADGLDREDYHASLIEGLAAAPGGGEAERIDLDLLRTDALVRLTYDLYFGRLDPERLDSDWNLGRDLTDPVPAQALARALDTGDVRALVAEMRPRHPLYGQLVEALAQYRQIAAEGGWPTIPGGPKLERGAQGARVLALRRRLAVSGDGPPVPASGGGHFDRVLAEAVKGFQRRHGLLGDGVVGQATLDALNVPVEARIDQIRVNLERARWALREAPDEFVVVDIAGFNAAYVRNGETLWRSRVQVGTPYRKTPTFRSEITYLVFNPTWTVPPTILAKDILPDARQNPGEVARRGLKVLDRQGREVDPGSVDWSRARASNFPYVLRQDPGPRNALGRIKFMFPNRHHIYLHDTPKKSLFDKPERAFSSGCIRIENPLELAELLLGDPERWNRDRLEEATGKTRTRTVFLPRPVPILLLYWTVFFDEAGRVGFKKDIYERDRAVLEALGQELPAARTVDRARPPAGEPASLTWAGEGKRAP
jgi:murein L,D-transpeptidase YcbB/YkuD